ncbi:serine/threonine-protein phosphatase 7 long form homolog [Arachis stenosperma]|uniref:serine/threonine-protein phosphatase 7 long form homolog n=1 Tax=Arachis stenosperma TaxID=217475 RepID=UPI0025ABBDDE|nr:serine/threonine-protein phosphatase 7 long form homolog [Arachis stenosperma]
MRRQQGMRLNERIVLYLQMAGLYHLARLNETWFRLDELLMSAFVERWRPEAHILYAIRGVHNYIVGRSVLVRAANRWTVRQQMLDTVKAIHRGRSSSLGVIPGVVGCIASNNTAIRRYARAYIMMLLETQLFGNKSGTRLRIRWLPYVARLEDMGGYSWGSAALSWLYRCMYRVANRNVV